MTAQRCQNRPSRWFTEAVLLDHYQAAGRTHIPIQLLVRDPPLRPVSEWDLEVSEFGLRDA